MSETPTSSQLQRPNNLISGNSAGWATGIVSATWAGASSGITSCASTAAIVLKQIMKKILFTHV